MSRLDPRSFEFALHGSYMTDPEVTYLEFDEGWAQWDLAQRLMDNYIKELENERRSY